MWADASFDDARQRLVELVPILAGLGEAETALWRLLLEQRKTQKRFNALKFNIIPGPQRPIGLIRARWRKRNAIRYFKWWSFAYRAGGLPWTCATAADGQLLHCVVRRPKPDGACHR
jgi:hypothetical protein